MNYQHHHSSSSIELGQSTISDSTICNACVAGLGHHLPHIRDCDKHMGSSLELGANSYIDLHDFRATRTCSKGIFGKVLNPRSNAILRYNQWFLVSCVVGAAIDPLFLSVLAINKELSCLYMQKGFAIAITALRSLVDIMYVWQIWLQLKLAYVSKKSLILGQGELVWDARKIARHYLLPLRRFWFDAFVILPIPQVMLWVFVPDMISRGGAKMHIMDYILMTFLFQYIPRVVHFVLFGWRLQRINGYIFGTATWGFVLNFAMYLCAAHVAGCIWYLLTVQRVESCIYEQCESMANCSFVNMGCPISVSYGPQPPVAWPQGPSIIHSTCSISTAVRSNANYSFGIYSLGVPLVTDTNPVNKIALPLFWGIMTMSSFGNALYPTDHTLEIAFSILVITCGLLLFTMLIGNIQVFLHSITAKKVQSQLRVRDLEWWMRHRQLPVLLRQRVRQYERQSWAATCGINEEVTIQNLPEGLRRDIKRHLCLNLVRQVPLFQHMDDLVLNNICERLKTVIFIENETVMNEGEPVRQMLFIVRGHMQSSYRLRHDNTMSSSILGPGNFCGDELILRCLDNSLGGNLPISTSSLTTLEVTEAFGLEAQDLEYIMKHFRHRFANAKLQRTIRFYSSRWRTWAAVSIQLAWRRHKARRWTRCTSNNATTSQTLHDSANTSPIYSTLAQPAARKNRLRLYTAMFSSPKPQDDINRDIKVLQQSHQIESCAY